jgi:hypothetical protein
MKVGSKVECIDDSIRPDRVVFVHYNYPMWVKKGTTYTVREILSNDEIVPGLLLEELVNPGIYIKLLDRVQEPAYRVDRFRELEDDKEAVEELKEVVNLEIELGV